MALKPHCIFQRGTGPIIAAAIHNGHQTRQGIERRLALDENTQFREEDPVTGEWTQVAKTQVVGLRSRFEVDLNRPRERAVYETPADAWGLQVWQIPPDRAVIDASLREYDQFYADVKKLIDEMLHTYPRLIVYDLHTYNQRRAGPNSPEADPRTNPEVNVGTGTMERDYWTPVVERFITELRNYDFHGRQLDVRENVKFRGGHFCRWLHQSYPRRVCALAIEFKKFFMNEWEGAPGPAEGEPIYKALESTVPGVRATLEKM